MAYFTEAENITKVYIEPQKTLNRHSNLEKEQVGAIMLPDIKLYYKATVIKTAWH